MRRLTPAQMPAPVLAVLLLAGCDYLVDPGGASQPAVRAAAHASPTPSSTPHTSKPRKQKTVIGRGWVGTSEEDATSYQLELPAGKYGAVDVTVSEAVYEACDFGDLYPECGERR